MLRSLDTLEEGFRSTAKQSKKECGKELEKIRQLTFIAGKFLNAIRECEKKPELEGILPKCYNSLVYTCFLELWRISGHILFLSCNGLYRNAFDDIRYILESIVQALYIDLRHPKLNIETKIEILKEVEREVASLLFPFSLSLTSKCKKRERVTSVCGRV